MTGLRCKRHTDSHISCAHALDHLCAVFVCGPKTGVSFSNFGGGADGLQLCVLWDRTKGIGMGTVGPHAAHPLRVFCKGDVPQKEQSL